MNYLTNSKITLRALEPEDLETLYAWENDTRLWRHGSSLTPYSRYILHRYIESASTDLYEHKQLRLMISLTSTGERIGMIDLYDFEPHYKRAAVGILIDELHQRKGYGKEALRLIAAYALNFLHLYQLYAYIPTSNLPSLDLFTGCGFLRSGTLRQWTKSGDDWEDVAIVQLLK